MRARVTISAGAGAKLKVARFKSGEIGVTIETPMFSFGRRVFSRARALRTLSRCQRALDRVRAVVEGGS